MMLLLMHTLCLFYIFIDVFLMKDILNKQPDDNG